MEVDKAAEQGSIGKEKSHGVKIKESDKIEGHKMDAGN